MRLSLAPALLSSFLVLGGAGCEPEAADTSGSGEGGETTQATTGGESNGESSGETQGQPAEVEFSNFRVEELSSVRALVRFDTSLDTTCELEYGLSTESMDGRATDPDMEPGTFLMEHQVPLEDLSPETTYWYRARAETEAGDVYFSEPMSLTTLADEGGETGGAELENVALLAAGAEVSAVSSNWAGGSNSDSFGANLAFDDMMSTAWSSDGDGDGAWVELTLSAPRALERVGFRSREMTDGTSKILSFTLLVDGTRTYGPFDTPDTTQVYAFDLDGEMGQTIRLETVTSSGGNTGIRELQLWSPVP